MGLFAIRNDVTIDTQVTPSFKDLYMGNETTATVRGGHTKDYYLLDAKIADLPTFGEATLFGAQLHVFIPTNGISQGISHKVPELAVYNTTKPINETSSNENEGSMSLGTYGTRDIFVVSAIEKMRPLWLEEFKGVVGETASNVSISTRSGIVYERDVPYIPYSEANFQLARSGILKKINSAYNDDVGWPPAPSINPSDWNLKGASGYLGGLYDNALDEGGQLIASLGAGYPLGEVNQRMDNPVVDTTCKSLTTYMADGSYRWYVVAKDGDPTIWQSDKSSMGMKLEWNKSDVRPILKHDETESNTADEEVQLISPATSIFDIVKGKRKIMMTETTESAVPLEFVDAASTFTTSVSKEGQAGKMRSFAIASDIVAKESVFTSNYAATASFKNQGLINGAKGYQETFLCKKHIPFPVKMNYSTVDRNAENSAVEIKMDVYIDKMSPTVHHYDATGEIDVSYLMRGLVITFSEEPPRSDEYLYDFVKRHALQDVPTTGTDWEDYEIYKYYAPNGISGSAFSSDAVDVNVTMDTTNVGYDGDGSTASGTGGAYVPPIGVCEIEREVFQVKAHLAGRPPTGVTINDINDGSTYAGHASGEAVIFHNKPWNTSSKNFAGVALVKGGGDNLHVRTAECWGLDESHKHGESGVGHDVQGNKQIKFVLDYDGFVGDANFDSGHVNKIGAGEVPVATGQWLNLTFRADIESNGWYLHIKDESGDDFTDTSGIWINNCRRIAGQSRYDEGTTTHSSPLPGGTLGGPTNAPAYWPSVMTIWVINYPSVYHTTKGIRATSAAGGGATQDYLLGGLNHDTEVSVYIDNLSFNNFNLAHNNNSRLKDNWPPTPIDIETTPSVTHGPGAAINTAGGYQGQFTSKYFYEGTQYICLGFKNLSEIDAVSPTGTSATMDDWHLKNFFFNDYYSSNLSSNGMWNHYPYANTTYPSSQDYWTVPKARSIEQSTPWDDSYGDEMGQLLFAGYSSAIDYTGTQAYDTVFKPTLKHRADPFDEQYRGLIIDGLERDNLSAGIAIDATTFTTASGDFNLHGGAHATRLEGGLVLIGDELVSYANSSETDGGSYRTYEGCARGLHGTTAAAHDSGAKVTNMMGANHFNNIVTKGDGLTELFTQKGSIKFLFDSCDINHSAYAGCRLRIEAGINANVAEVSVESVDGSTLGTGAQPVDAALVEGYNFPWSEKADGTKGNRYMRAHGDTSHGTEDNIWYYSFDANPTPGGGTTGGGILSIDDEIIKYTDYDHDDGGLQMFKGLTRGAAGTTGTTHATNQLIRVCGNQLDVFDDAARDDSAGAAVAPGSLKMCGPAPIAKRECLFASARIINIIADGKRTLDDGTSTHGLIEVEVDDTSVLKADAEEEYIIYTYGQSFLDNYARTKVKIHKIGSDGRVLLGTLDGKKLSTSDALIEDDPAVLDSDTYEYTTADAPFIPAHYDKAYYADLASWPSSGHMLNSYTKEMMYYSSMQRHVSDVATALSAGINDSVVTFDVTSTTGLTAGDYISVQDPAHAPAAPLAKEIMRIASVDDANTLTVEARGDHGTAAYAFDTSDALWKSRGWVIGKHGVNNTTVPYRSKNDQYVLQGDILTEFNIGNLFISPQRYWIMFAVQKHNTGPLALGEDLPTRQYNGIVSTSPYITDYGATFNEWLFTDDTVGGVNGAYARSRNLDPFTEKSAVINNQDFGFGVYSTDNSTGGRAGESLIQTENDYASFNMVRWVNNKGISPGKTEGLLVCSKEVEVDHEITMQTAEGTNKPFMLTWFLDKLPAKPTDFMVKPNEENAYIPEFTWSSSDGDLWYGFLHVDTVNILSQYHNAVAWMPMNEVDTTASLLYKLDLADTTGTAATADPDDVTNTREGLAGNAKHLNGTVGPTIGIRWGNDSVSPYTESPVASYNEFSTVVHFVPDSGSGTIRYIFTQENKFEIFLTASNTVSARLYPGDGAGAYVAPYVTLTGTTVVPADGRTPTNVILTLDTHLEEGNAKLFVNGRLEDITGPKGDTNQWPDKVLNNSEKYLYAGCSTAGTMAFLGKIEEFVIYNSVLYPVVPAEGTFNFTREVPELGTGSEYSSSKSWNAKLFIKDYHNIRGNTELNVTCTPNVSFRKAGFMLDTT